MTSEAYIRFGAFFGIFAAMAIWEIAAPMRRRAVERSGRWITNWALSILNTAVTALMKIGLGAAAVIAALDADARQIGILNQTGWPGWLEICVAFVVMDLMIWGQHLLSHKIPVLWRLHRVHHADRDMDVTTAIRFHPIEIALSMALKIALVYAFGVPVVAVILFEVVLNGASMFNHANIRLGRAERWIRLLIVTPDMHRIHHSTDRREHDSNYGFNLSIWDRILGTYVAAPRDGHHGMTVGLAGHQNLDPTKIVWSLGFPFRK